MRSRNTLLTCLISLHSVPAFGRSVALLSVATWPACLPVRRSAWYLAKSEE